MSLYLNTRSNCQRFGGWTSTHQNSLYGSGDAITSVVSVGKRNTDLFNASLDGNIRRAIDINEKAFKSLIRAAAPLNEL